MSSGTLAGFLARRTDPTGRAVDFGWDAAGNLARTTVDAAGLALTACSAYDGDGNLIK